MRATSASLVLCLLLALPLPSCGTLLFAERQDQDNTGNGLDPNILILDGIGLLFWIVPGLVAYGIDFYTGTVYLPDGVERGEGPFIRDKRTAPAEAGEE